MNPTDTSAHRLSVIALSASGRPRTFRVACEHPPTPRRNAAYRYLATVILGAGRPNPRTATQSTAALMSIVVPMLLLLILNYAAGRWAYDSRYSFDERTQDLVAWARMLSVSRP
jgi:hypothetical protein